MAPLSSHSQFAPRFIRIAIVFAIITPLLAGCAAHTSTHSPDIPREIAMDGPIVATVHATGFQIYTCVADSNSVRAWKLKAPDATFANETGLKGKHYAGPTWEASDGSLVTGKKVAEARSPDPNAVPWLLLSANEHKGSGTLANVTFIQRLRTSGGKPPAIETSKPGDEARVPYTADYVFYGPNAKRAVP